MNFAVTVDGRATIAGVSGPIGSDADTAMLVGLRKRFDAVLIGAGTMRAERYGPLPDGRPLAIVAGSLDLPWDASLFTEERGRAIVFTASEQDPPPSPPRSRSSGTRARSTSPRRCATCATSAASTPCSVRAGPACTPRCRRPASSTSSS